MKKPSAKPATKRVRTVLDIEDICARVAAGESLRDIAARYGRAVSKLCEWLSADTARAERYRQAREHSAQHWDAKAEDALAGLEFDEVTWKFDVTKARELASHYRWRAAKVAPRTYGDKLAVGGDADAPPIQTAIQVTFVTPKGAG